MYLYVCMYVCGNFCDQLTFHIKSFYTYSIGISYHFYCGSFGFCCLETPETHSCTKYIEGQETPLATVIRCVMGKDALICGSFGQFPFLISFFFLPFDVKLLF